MRSRRDPTHTPTPRRAPLAIAGLVAALGIALAGCASNKNALVPPQTQIAPYDSVAGIPLWAVAPLRNESGTTLADELAITDKVIAAVAQVEGIRAIPLDRTLAAMQYLGMRELTSPADAEELAAELGADGVLVGSITAYDPYDPPTLGLALALYVPPGKLGAAKPISIDTQRLTYQPTDYNPLASPGATREQPASVVSEHLDARSHAVLMRVKTYAQGRSDPASGFGWKIYLVSMDRYTEFAAWHAVGRLIDHEWLRLAAKTVAGAG